MDKFETEMMEKIAKQQRSKMNKFQICYVQQLLTTESMKRLVMPKNKWVDEGEGDKGGNDRGGDRGGLFK